MFVGRTAVSYTHLDVYKRQFSIIMALSINAKIAGMFLIVVVLLAVAVYLILRVAMPKFKMVQEKLDKVNTVMRECLAGIRAVSYTHLDVYKRQKRLM